MSASSVPVACDPYNLQRFMDAQSEMFAVAVSELQAGQKRDCWMWFIFPQICGLGNSSTSRKYAITSVEEARAYLGHPVLGPRLIECTRLVLLTEGRSIQQIFGDPDWMKFRSSMTLFSQVASGENVFQTALEKYFEGVPDDLTLNRI